MFALVRVNLTVVLCKNNLLCRIWNGSFAGVGALDVTRENATKIKGKIGTAASTIWGYYIYLKGT